jgi:hypothetical protein
MIRNCTEDWAISLSIYCIALWVLQSTISLCFTLTYLQQNKAQIIILNALIYLLLRHFFFSPFLLIFSTRQYMHALDLSCQFVATIGPPAGINPEILVMHADQTALRLLKCLQVPYSSTWCHCIPDLKFQEFSRWSPLCSFLWHLEQVLHHTPIILHPCTSDDMCIYILNSNTVEE